MTLSNLKPPSKVNSTVNPKVNSKISSKAELKPQAIATDDIYRHDTPVTPIQSGAFNSILTNISKHIYFLLQSEDVPNFLTHVAEQQVVKDTTQDIEEWQTQKQQHKQWLTHIDNNFEMVLNHLYKIILPEVYVFFHDDSTTTTERRKIHKMTADILQKFEIWRYTASTEYTPLQKQIMGNHVNLAMADDYLIGKGDNADIACKILPLAKLSDIDGFHYLQNLRPLFQTLSEDKWLLDFLSLEGSEIVKQLDYWQKQRLSRFSIPDTQMLYSQPNILFDNVRHPLIQHIQQNMDNGYIVRVHNSHQITQLSNNQAIVIKDKKLKKAIFFGITGIVSIVTAFWLHNILMTPALIIIAIPFLLLAISSIKEILIFSQSNDDYGDENNGNNKNISSQHNRKEANNNQVRNAQNKPQSTQILLPINLHRHAYYLAQLLSSDGINLLNQLISEINQAHAHLDYLREYHPYLATSVHELIMDVTINSVLRLDQVAQNSVQSSQASSSAKAMFAQNHEVHVVELFHNHLEELQDLNTSIMEKQMAGFATVGSEVERQFRDRIMELRILLKWFIAQAPDTELGVSADEVLLNKLEESTLKQMQDVFYQDDTTDEQRAELQHQIDELLSHFQAQSPKHTELKHNQDLLKLTHDPDLLYKSETQDFIDFNKQYVKQLKQHW